MKERGDVVRPLSECLASVDSPEGRRRVFEYIESQPFPHFKSVEKAGLLIRIDEDGTETVGRFADGEFKACE